MPSGVMVNWKATAWWASAIAVCTHVKQTCKARCCSQWMETLVTTFYYLLNLLKVPDQQYFLPSSWWNYWAVRLYHLLLNLTEHTGAHHEATAWLSTTTGHCSCTPLSGKGANHTGGSQKTRKFYVPRDPSPDLRGLRPGDGGGTCQVPVSHGGALQPWLQTCITFPSSPSNNASWRGEKRFSPEDAATFVANYKRSSSPN